MKRLFFGFGIAVSLALFSSCAQNDSQSPDTSGAAPYGADQPNAVGIDTVTESTRVMDSANNNPQFPATQTDGNGTPSDKYSNKDNP